jgi:hypothetical protein
MAAHPEIQKVLAARGGKTVDNSVAGITTVAAANNNFSMQELEDLFHAAKASGYEMVLSAGVLKIRPRDTAL